jgi:GrpB-like predicted nucleotidyltransferase (UPF0157 family)
MLLPGVLGEETIERKWKNTREEANQMNDPIVKIEIVEYDPHWPDLYAEERARVEVVLGDLAESIEHIGSTSVPGLSAKPIIDILVTVAHLGPVDPYIERLGSLDYTYFPVLGNTVRYAFGKGIPHTHHIHIVEHGGEAHLRPLAFRDYLRTHPEAAQQYELLKRQLADRFHGDRQAYNQAKTDFISNPMIYSWYEQANHDTSSSGLA